jgi:hypothetical protein
MFAVSLPMEGVEAELARVEGVFAPYKAGLYLNFEERPVPEGSFFSAETHARLRAVKAKYDPNQLIRANHPIRPAA